MNLHSIVFPVISAINPMTPLTIRVSTGYTVDAEGRQVPAYTPVTALGQVQALSFRDIQMLAGLTLNGTRRAIYITGNFDSTDRVSAKGGDLIVFDDTPNIPSPIRGTVWLVAMQLEAWDEPNWCKVAVTLQNESPS